LLQLPNHGLLLHNYNLLLLNDVDQLFWWQLLEASSSTVIGFGASLIQLDY